MKKYNVLFKDLFTHSIDSKIVCINTKQKKAILGSIQWKTEFAFFDKKTNIKYNYILLKIEEEK